MEDLNEAFPVKVDCQAVRVDAGRQLRKQYRDQFPTNHLSDLPNSTSGWQSAVAHGATLEWALRIVGLALRPDYRVGGLLRLASAVPVDLVDGLLADGWTTNELYDLICWKGDAFFPATVRRTRTLYRNALGASGSDSDLLWYSLAAVLSADRAGPPGLTDLQALRWLQVAGRPGPQRGWDSRFNAAVKLADNAQGCFQEWVPVAGPDGWVWAAAGFTSDEARVLIALPDGHPDRPGPDQLTVMAALRRA